jgi:hypothetical protein
VLASRIVASWHVRFDNPKTPLKICDDATLITYVKSGRCSGMELVAPVDGDGNWVPLHTLPFFRTAAGCTLEDDVELIAMRRRGNKRRLIGTLFGIYLGSSFIAGMAGNIAQHNRTGAAIAAATVAAAVGSTIVLLRRRSKRNEDAVAKKLAEAHDELLGALGALEKDLEAAPTALRDAADVPQLRKVIVGLRGQQRLLAELAGGPTAKVLEAQLGTARARQQAAVGADARLKDALSDEVRALEHRLSEVQATDRARLEVTARRRALLHEIQGLRLVIGRARADMSLENATVDRLAELHRQLHTETEIAEDDIDPGARARGRASAKA